MDKKKFDLPETFNIDGVEIFATGKWNGDKYVDKDLENMVRAFEETKPTLKPYLKLGHCEGQELAQADGLPAVGWVERLRKVGDKLVADFRNVPKKIYELIKSGAYRRVSSEIFFDIEVGKKMFPRALKAVSLLGADTPAVGNLADIMGMYKLFVAEKNSIVKIYDYEKREDCKMEMDLATLMAVKEDLEKKIAAIQAENEELAKDVEGKDKMIEDKDKMAEEKGKMAEKVEKKLAEAVKECDEIKAEIAKNKIESRRKEIIVEVDKIIADPKTFAMPVDKDVLCKLIEHNEIAEVKKYSFGEGDKAIEKTVTEMFTEVLGRERVTLNTDNKSQIGANAAGNEDNTVLHEKALKYAKENKVSYTDALIKVS